MLSHSRSQTTFSELKQFLNTHKEVMLQHIRMLNDIKNNKVNEEEFADYIEDVVGLTRKLTIKEKEQVINDLMASALTACKSAISLSLLIKDEMGEAEINSLYITFKYLLEEAGKNNNEFKSKATPWDYKARHAFNLRDISKYCLKKIKSHLTESIEKLNAICKIQTQIINPRSNNKKIFEYEFRTNIYIEIDRLTFYYKSRRSDLHKYAFELDFKKIKKANNSLLEEIGKLKLPNILTYNVYTLIKEKHDQIGKICEFGFNQPNNSKIEEVINYVYTNVFNACGIINILDKLEILINQIADALEEDKAVEEFIKCNQSIILDQLTKLSKECEYLLTWLIDKHRDECSTKEINEINKFIQLIENTKNAIENEIVKWSNELIFGSLSDAQAYQQLTKVIVSCAVDEIENANSCLEMLDLKKADIVLKSESNAVQPRIINLEKGKQRSSTSSLSEEITLFKEKKAEETKAYKGKVTEARIKKQDEKYNSNVSVSSASFFPAARADFIPNESMQSILDNLKRDDIEILRDILNKNLNAKISYHDVCLLIVNHLGGSIEEIGNGSSHKRIRIGKFYTELTSSRDAVSEKEVTGGIFRPHGGQHNKALLSRFNLELVANTLLKAGITCEVLAELETKLSLTI